MTRRQRGGFTLIELLVVLTIIGLIMAIAIPNLLAAVQKAKQKRSMSDMRWVATAIESYAIDYRNYPPAAMQVLPVLYGGIPYPTGTLGQMANYVTPSYLKVLPLVDGWNSWFLYEASEPDYAVVSAGRDGVPAEPPGGGPTTNFNTDIVYADGQFTVYPSGIQQ
jgi:type II secretion system protein G